MSSRTLLRLLCRAKLCRRTQEVLSILITSVAGVENPLRLGELLLGFSDGHLVGHPGVLAQDRNPTLGGGDEAAFHSDDLPSRRRFFAEDHNCTQPQHTE